MAGIFDYLVNGQGMGGGILAQPQQAPPAGGLLTTAQATPPGSANFMSGLTEFFQNNPGMISALAAGIGSAPSMRQGIAQAAGAMPQAMAYDTQRNQDRQSKAAVTDFFSDPENAKAISPGMMKLLQKYPALAEKYVAGQITSLSPTTDDIKEYNIAKSQGYTGTFVDYMTKVKGASQAQENTFGTPIFRYDDKNNVVGYDLFTNRGTIYHYDSGGKFLGESRTGTPGAAPSGAPGDPGATAQAGPPTQPSVPGAARPPGSVKLGDQGTSLGIFTPGGAQVGSAPVDVTGKAAGTAAGTAQAADLKDVNNTAIKATSQLTTLAQMRRLSEDPNFYSGAGGEPVLAAKKLLAALGGDPSLAASGENFAALSNKLIYDKLGTLGNQISNGDRDFITRTIPNLGQTPQGIKGLLDIYEALAKRDIEVAKLAQQYAKDKGAGTRLDQNWSTYLAEWAQKNPLFGGAGKPDPLGIR